jgi:hypothetical protein
MFKKLVMAFTSGKTIIGDKEVSNPMVVNTPISQNESIKLDENQLNSLELGFLLEMVKNVNFRGDQVELVFNLIMKLQNQYMKQTKQ